MSPESLPAESLAQRYAEARLRDLGQAPPPLDLRPVHPARRAARCGLTALTGLPEAEPLPCIAPLAAAADGLLAALKALAPSGDWAGLDGAALLTARAADFGHRRAGAVSAGGSCQLLTAADGGLALNLARPEDWDLMPAWLDAPVAAQDWAAVARAVAMQRVAALVSSGRELGLAVAADVLPPAQTWCVALDCGTPTALPSRPPRVLDLTALWAGPLCGDLLRRCGAEVVKLESSSRPDGARRGPSAFFNRLNAGKYMAALDFATAEGRAGLQALAAQADIILEGSRPRALRQLGLVAEDWLAARAGRVWVSLSGHGRADPQGDWVAFGDDAGVAAGLSALLHETTGAQAFVGDAIADPVTGLHAALAAWSAWRQGGARLLALSLAGTVNTVLRHELPPTAEARRARHRAWTVHGGDVEAPMAPPPAAIAGAIGADTAAVWSRWAC